MTTPSYSALVAALRAAGCVFAEDEARLLLDEGLSPAELNRAVQRRVGGEPLEQVLGWVAFGGLRILLDPGVFVPRRRTELLAGAAAELARSSGAQPVVLDLCCGSGAVGAVVLAGVPEARLHAVDIDPLEVACAVRNVGDRAVVGDLFDPLPSALKGTVSVIVANVPYVPTSHVAMMPSEARDFEPLVALDGGADGLDIAGRVAALAPAWLRPGGALLIETSEAQAPALMDLFAQAGLRAQVMRREDIGATIVVGTAPGVSASG